MKRLLKNITLSLFSLLVAALLAEFTLRQLDSSSESFTSNVDQTRLNHFGIKRSGVLTEAYFKNFEELNKNSWHQPHTHFLWPGQLGRKIEFLNDIQWNNLGCNDSLDYQSTQGKSAILFLGDSFIEALQVPAEKNFYNLLRQNLKSRNIDVWGCGWSGWSPIYAYLNLNAEALLPEGLERGGFFPGLDQLRPKHVFYFIFLGNDLRNEAFPVYQAFKTEQAEQQRSCVSVPTYRSLLLSKLVHFYYMYLRKSEPNLICVMDELWPYLELKHPTVQAGFKQIQASLLLLKEQVEKSGARLTIGVIEPYPVPYGEKSFRESLRFSYPDVKDLPVDLEAPASQMIAILKELSIPYVNFSEVFAKDHTSDHYLLSDGHLSEMGHRAIKDYLLKEFDLLFPEMNADTQP